MNKTQQVQYGASHDSVLHHTGMQSKSDEDYIYIFSCICTDAREFYSLVCSKCSRQGYVVYLAKSST